MTLLDDIHPAAQQLRLCFNGWQPRRAVILGSGLSAAADLLTFSQSFPFARLPGFVSTGVSGHAGQLCAGQLDGVATLMFQGRYHVYEGYSPWQVTAPVRLAAELGCTDILLTNAAGGIAEQLDPGDFMLVTDHLNLTGLNPLCGRRERDFTDLGKLYRQPAAECLERPLEDVGIGIHRGVLAWMPGPSYETPAEINFLAAAGAAAVSMSTIPEAIVARRYGLEVSAVSLITNPASGRAAAPLDHREVLAAGQRAEEQAAQVVQQLLR